MLAVLCACAVWRSCRSHPPQQPSGVLVFMQLDTANSEWRWRWLDVASGTSGDLGYHGSGQLSYVEDRRAVWMRYAGETRSASNGAMFVERRGHEVASRFVRDVAVAGVSPDGTHAAIVPHYPGNMDDVLQLARVTPSGFAPGPSLRVKFVNTEVFGWFDSESALVGHDGYLLRATTSQRPVKLRACGACWYGSAAHDMRSFAWASDPAEDGRQVLQIASLRDGTARPRRIAIGTGHDARCEFAPGDRTLACMVGDAYVGVVDVVLVDVASGQVTAVGRGLGPSMSFSPDGQWLAIWDDEMTLVPVDGTRPRVRLGRERGPIAWLR